MKRLTNILSYLCLLLLLLVAACSDLEEIVVNMQGEEEVELTIQTNIPSLGGSTRTAPTENITSITALAFDSDHELIKVAIEDVTISPSATPSTSGTYTVKVPVRTRRIHFIAKNNGTFDTFSTETDYGKGENELLQDLTTNELHYWGKLDFVNADELKSGGDVTLIRNMAKLVLDTDSDDDYIAGLLNYNVKGTIVPYKDGELGYQTATNHDLPTDFDIASDETESTDKDKVHYMFEELNDIIGETTDLVYAICKIGGKYYKIAFKSGDNYYYIIRNQVYTIKIAGTLDDKLGKDTYADAVQNGSPINDTTKEQVHITFEPDEETTFAIADNEVSMYLGEPGKVKVIIPEGITELQIGYSAEYFDEGGLTANVIDGDVIVATNTETKDNIYIKTYNVTDIREFELSIDLKESVTEAIDGMEIQFIGSGELKQSNDKLIVDVVKRDDIILSKTAVEIPKSAGSEFTVSVTMPSFDNYTGNFKLQVTDVDDKFTIAPELQDGEYTVEEGSTTTFTFTLEADGNVGDKYKINFDAISDFHHLTGTTTVTLIDDAVPDQDVYEIWVGDGNGNAWTGTTNSVEFFGYKTTADNGFIKNESSPTRTDFYDTGANAHISKAMQMGSDDSFTFTIPAGDSRWLTMLVAANSGTPSINLTGTLANGESWTTTAETNATKVDGTYNFGNGEIGTAGRLIRYELPAGTYTLQGSDAAAYLLYYMRVSKAKPEMTDVATDVTASNYTLAWSGGEWNNYTKINDTYFVDDDATTFTPTLTYKGLTGVKLAASSSLNITTGKYSFSDNQGDGTAITYNEVTSNNNGSDNGDIAIKATVIDNESITYNAGTYALSGIAKVTDTEYKYAAFYDVLRLNTVGFTVKNTIKLGLYYSWNGDANTITEYVDGLPYIIGLRMPYSLPVAINAENDTSTPINFTIDSNWSRRESGLGVICNAPNYQLASQQEGNSSNNRVHPRPEWTYKIEWYEVAANTIQPTTTDTDIYFSYGKDNSGNAYITKSPVIATTKSASEKLALTLDFSSNSENESTHTLNFGNDFYLRATISAEDANKYAGAHVRLQGVFSNTQGGGNSAIHWTNSRKDGSIEYARNSSDGTQLQFEIKAGQTTYEIHWQFVRDDGSTTTPTQFTYTVDNDAYNIANGSESATIVLNGNGQVVDNPLSIELDFYADEDGDENVDNQGNSFNNLLLNTSHVYLKAKISSEDAAKYDGKQVILTGTYPSQNAEIGGLAIHWVDSKKSVNNNNNIWYTNNTGESLQFNVHSGILEYLIEWVFVTGQHYKGGDIGFTYNISNYAISGVDGTFNNFAGDTSATIAFANEPIYLDIYSDADTDDGNDISIVSGSQLVMKAIVPSDITTGTITFDLSGSTGVTSGITWNDRAGQSVEFSWPNITLTVVENQRDYYLYWNPTVSDERSATLNFTVSGNYNLNSVGNTSYSKAITVSRTVIDDEDFSNFKNVGPGSVSVEDGILCLTNNTDRQNAWDAQAMYETNGIEYGETYTLTFKAKIANNTQGEMAVAIQRFENGECVATDHYRIFTINDINNAKKENQDWAEFTYDITIQDNNQETPNENNPTHFMFNFGDLVGTLNIYDLTLVRNNQ